MKNALQLSCLLMLCVGLLTGCAAGGNAAGGEGAVSGASSSEAVGGNAASSAPAAASAASAASGSTGASGASSEEALPVRVVALKGPTAMGMVQMMDEADGGRIEDIRYDFRIAGAVDEVPPLLAKSEADIAALPANLASVIYNNNNSGFQVLAINTLGVLYIVENGSTVASVADLKGKTLYASGKGATPEYALNYILSENGIDPAGDVTIEWKSEHAECLASLLADENGIAMLPQPFVTTAMTQNETLRAALDLTAEWDALQTGEAPSALITGVVIARRAFVEENPSAVEDFLQRYKASVEYVNSETEQAAALIGKYDIVPEQVARKALPACNIVYIDGAEMKEKLSGYLGVLMEQNPQAVGGALPGDDFYY